MNSVKEDMLIWETYNVLSEGDTPDGSLFRRGAKFRVAVGHALAGKTMVAAANAIEVDTADFASGLTAPGSSDNPLDGNFVAKPMPGSGVWAVQAAEEGGTSSHWILITSPPGITNPADGRPVASPVEVGTYTAAGGGEATGTGEGGVLPGEAEPEQSELTKPITHVTGKLKQGAAQYADDPIGNYVFGKADDAAKALVKPEKEKAPGVFQYD